MACDGTLTKEELYVSQAAYRYEAIKGERDLTFICINMGMGMLSHVCGDQMTSLDTWPHLLPHFMHSLLVTTA